MEGLMAQAVGSDNVDQYRGLLRHKRCQGFGNHTHAKGYRPPGSPAQKRAWGIQFAVAHYSLVDLAVWLGKTLAPTKEEPKTIVTEFNNVTTAFMVSGVNRIHRISWEQVEQPNAYMASVSSNTIVGVVKLEGRIVFLLDLEKLLPT